LIRAALRNGISQENQSIMACGQPVDGQTALYDLYFVKAEGFHTNHILKDLRAGGGLSFPPILKFQPGLI
jgi:hypothetical protein